MTLLMLRRVGRLLRRALRRPTTFSSKQYWEGRYRREGNSGAGSYGRLAKFKAEVLNGFVAEHRVSRVLEVGCGDGNQLSLAQYENYVGIDTAPSAIRMCERRFSGTTHRFLLDTDQAYRWAKSEFRPQLVLSLDVIFHLVENQAFEDYMAKLFGFDAEYVCVYSSNGPFRVSAPHVRHWHFTAWIQQHAPEWGMTRYIPNRYPFDESDPDNTSFSDFHFFSRRR